MDWMVWLGGKHIIFVHLPIAAALMSPIPIIAAQRGGRGIRPWWTTCRYLAWVGVVGSLLALASGWSAAKMDPALMAVPWKGPVGMGLPYLYRMHQVSALLTLVLGLGCLRALYRNRQEHQGIGIPALLLGLLWCGGAYLASYTGAVMAGRRPPLPLLLAPPQVHEAPPPNAPPIPPAPATSSPQP